MKAVMKCENAPRKTRLVDIPVPVCGDDQILLKVMAAGVCGSDVDIWNHNVGFELSVPVVQGHEFCGEIVEAGRLVSDYKPGDRVVCETAAQICGKCYYCRTGQYNQCPQRLGFGAKIDGAFSEYVAVPQRILHKIPDGLDYVRASLTEPVCVAYNALVVNSRINPGTPVVVIGPGTIGLLCVAVAKLAGAYPLIVIGRDSSLARLDAAKTLGADVIVNSSKENPAEIVNRLTDGLGAPLVVDCAGSSQTFRLSMELVARNGQITKLGWGPEPIGVSIDPLVAKAASVKGSFSHTWHTWETVIRLIQAGRVDLTLFSDHVYPIEEWEAAFAAMDSRECVKSVILPNGPLEGKGM